MKLTAKDLRIGNLIHSLETGETQLITGINEEYVSINAITWGYVSYEEIEPIPLTEEWLLKFGFKRHDVGPVSAQFSYGVNPVTQDYLLYLVWIKDYEVDYELKDFPFFLNGHFEIRTVHQLQNLFHALTGEELTYE